MREVLAFAGSEDLARTAPTARELRALVDEAVERSAREVYKRDLPPPLFPGEGATARLAYLQAAAEAV